MMSAMKCLMESLKDGGIHPVSALAGSVGDLYRLPLDQQNEMKGLLIADAFKRHFRDNAFYRQHCLDKGVRAEDINGFEDINRIPLIHIQKFKSASSHELLSRPLSSIEHEMRSTGTSGVPSIARRCRQTVDYGVLAVFALFREFFQISKGAGLYLCPSTEEIPEMGLIKALNMLAGLLDTRQFMVKQETMVPERAVAQLHQWQDHFTRHLIGPPFLIHRLISYLKATDTRLKLDRDTLVITLGGWKRFTGQMISRRQFNEECAEYLGIAPGRVRDVYALVESNILAIEDEHQVKHVAPYGYYSVRDPNDLSKEVPVGEQGQLAIFDPLSLATPGMILTEDIVRLLPMDSPSGRTGQLVQYIMRVPAAKEFGCCAVTLERTMDQASQTVCPVI